MACTRQSALKYIEDRTCDLIRVIRNPSSILENLHECKVFNSFEVEDIEGQHLRSDKVRQILTWVKAKGEAACYELLKALYLTRNRTLPKKPPQQSHEQLGLAASQDRQEYDYHHWISCFQFKEDIEMEPKVFPGSRPCHMYQKQLKSKAQKITQDACEQRCSPPDSNGESASYTPLVLDTDVIPTHSKIKMKSKKCKKARPKKMNTYIPNGMKETSPADLLKTHHENVLLVGKPGIGKTTVTHQMLKIWAESEHKKQQYMFYFDAKDMSCITNVTNLEGLLFDMYIEPENIENKEEVLQDIKDNSENVVIIFDGLSDLSSQSIVKKLMGKDLLPDAKIVITCRPEVESEEFLSKWPKLRVEVKGFSDKSIRAYFTKMLSSQLDCLSNVLNNLELFSLCHVPMYAMMVVTCILYRTSDASKQPCTVTEMYINILRHCIQKHFSKPLRYLDKCIREKREEILALAEIAFDATQQKTVNLTAPSYEEGNVQSSFLGVLMVKVAATALRTFSAFLHYTVQEFFAALWLLDSSDKSREFLQKCQTEEGKHLKHLVPFLCGLRNEMNIELVNCLIPELEKQDTTVFFHEVLNAFSPPQTNQDSDSEQSTSEIDVLFLCQCCYELQSTKACLLLLDKLEYHLDLSGEDLDPHHCCTVSYVISQSGDRKVELDLNDCTVSEQGLKLILGSMRNVQCLGSDPSMMCELWTTALHCGREIDLISLLGLCKNELHLSVSAEGGVFERAKDVMKRSGGVDLYLHWDMRTSLSDDLSTAILNGLPYINTLRCTPPQGQRGFPPEEWRKIEKTLFLNLCLQAALSEREGLKTIVEKVLSLSDTFHNQRCDFLLDLCSHVKDHETQTGRSVLPALRPFYQSAPVVWYIDLSERKASLLLEVLKLQPGKRPVELRGWSDEESEVRSFLQCLPYISQLWFSPKSEHSKQFKFLVALICKASELEEQTGEKTLELLPSVFNHSSFPFYRKDDARKYRCDFLLDLYSHVKDHENQTVRSVLPALRPFYQSAPAVWYIDLSERKASLFLEVLKLQPEKKRVVLRGWSDEESEVRSFLQCLPYISQLCFIRKSECSKQFKFLVALICKASELEEQTGEKTLELLSSVCSYSTFPVYYDVDGYIHYDDGINQCDFLLDLYLYVKDHETQTGRSVLPALRPCYQSASAVWCIDLSERKASLLLEVLKLQTGKKRVELTGWSDEESEVRSFLQCLPYISQLCLSPETEDSKNFKFLEDLICKASELEEQTGEKTLELLSSVCSYSTFPLYCDDDDDDDGMYQCDFLLDLCSHVKDHETQTGRSVLPALRPFYQSAPAVWYIDVSKRKASILLEVLKLQTGKKRVELTGWSDEESEVRSFLQCLPYISQLCLRRKSEDSKDFKFLGDLICKASELEEQTGEKTLELLSSVCSYSTFPLYCDDDDDDDDGMYQCDFLLDLCSHVKDHETQTGRSVLPALRPFYQSAPAVWYIDVSKRKASILLEVLKLQPGKKRVELRGWSNEESEMKYFLQCLPYISQLRLPSESVKQLVVVVYEAQDQDLTQSFLEKIAGDLTCCTLSCEVLLYLLQCSTQNITVDLRKNSLLEKDMCSYLPFLSRIILKRANSRFVMSAIREIFVRRANDCVSSLLRSSAHVINLNSRKLNREDCAALCFALEHSDGVKLNLLWASIPPGGVESILPLLDKVSHLSVHRRLLLRFLHCCAASEIQQGAAAALLRALQHRLDFSCSSSLDLSEQDEEKALCLSAEDCRAVSLVLQHVQSQPPTLTQLILRDCEVEDARLDQLFPILHKVCLSSSKALLLQLLCLVPVRGERRSVTRAVSLCRAMGRELDLSETRLDQRACETLALVLEHSEGLSELDLSHCQLTDHLLEPLLTHLHKAQVLDLSHNDITDGLTEKILQAVSMNSSTCTVRLYNNRIMDRSPFMTDKRFEIW